MATLAENRQRLLNNRFAAPPARPTFLLGQNGIGPPYGAPAANYYVTEMQQLGMSANRSYISWATIQPTQGGPIDWTLPDAAINTIAAGGMFPVMQLIYTPNYANTGSYTHSDRPFADTPPYPSADFDQWCVNWAGFATVCAQRYGHTCAYEVWNEWNVNGIYYRQGGSTTSKASVVGYAQLFAAIYNAIKAVDAAAKVVIGGMLYTSVYTGSAGTNGVLTTGQLITALNALSITPDAHNIHPYQVGGGTGDPTLDNFPTKNSFIDIGRIQTAMIKGGWGNVPLWSTESGYISSGVEAGAFNAGSEAKKAEWVRQQYDTVHYCYSRGAVGPGKAGVENFTYYHLENYSNGTVDTDSTGLYTGTPTGGPHTQLASGGAVQDFLARYNAGLRIPLLQKLTLTGPSSLVVTQTGASYSITSFDDTGVAMSCSPIYKSGVPSVATINSATGALTITGAGTTPVYAYAINATRSPIYSNLILLTVAAQTPTTSTVSPNPWNAAAAGGTVQFTATVFDQLGAVIPGVAGTWSSSDPTNAPIDPSTGILTPMGASVGVVVTFTPTGFPGAAGTSTGTIAGSVTSVTIGYTGTAATDAMTSGMLLFTGTTYQLVPQDQYGNTLPTASGNWASSDATNFPVSSGGRVSPAAGIGGGTVTFTHTASSSVGTVNVSVLKTPTSIAYQGNIPSLANTAALMAQIKNTLTTDAAYNSGLPVPTGNTGTLYQAGVNVNHVSVVTADPTKRFMGNPVMSFAIPSTSAAAGQISVVLSGSTQRWFALQLIQFDTNFTLVGTGGGTAGFNVGNYLYFTPTGRAGRDLTNGTTNTGTGGHPGGVFKETLFLGDSGGNQVGGPSSTSPYGGITTEFYAGDVWCHMTLYESVGGNIMSTRDGWFKIGDTPAMTGTQASGITEGPMQGGANPVAAVPLATRYQPTPINYTQAPPVTQLNCTIPIWMLVDGDITGDPFGILGDTSIPTLTGISGGTLAPGATNAVITLPGTNFTNNCQPLFSTTDIVVQSINRASFPTSMAVTVSVKATATPGSYTVLVNNQSSQTNSGTQAVTISSGTGFDTTTYNATTGAGIGGSSGVAPITRGWDVANRWANDTAWRAQFANFNLVSRPNWIYGNASLNGTGAYNNNPALSAQYDDGVYIDLVQWQNSVQYGGEPTFKYQIVGANLASSAPVAETSTNLVAGINSGWMWCRRQYQTNWTNVGDADNTNGGATFNAGQNASYKAGPFVTYSTGRGGVVTGNGTGHTAQWFTENNPGNTNGVGESYSGYTVGAEWTGGAFYDYLIRVTQFLGGNGNMWAEVTAWERPIGAANYSRLSKRLTGDLLVSTAFDITHFNSSGLNMNQSFKTDQFYYQWGYAIWDQASNSDPLGVVAYEAGLTPSIPTGNVFSSKTSSSVTCTVTISLYTAALRPVVDGVDITGQDFTIPSTVSEGGHVAPTVTGVAAGSRTIGWKAINANGTALSAQSSTITVTV